LQLYELEILTQYALHRAFEPSSFAAGNPATRDGNGGLKIA